MLRSTRLVTLAIAACLWGTSILEAQRLEVPRKHDRPPGPPLSPEEAVAKMTVPEGFSVEIVAAEPDVVNPVAMFIDEKGRFWITESFEYPRREPGPGKDRIKVIEDTDGDGKVDKVTVFAEGLNIPSGIAVGYGGVWVANSPDILFLQDTDGDLKADKTEVVVTGFGRTDTHELPNSFTWGPDGWLYGLNGVFNYCDVRYAQTNPNYKADHPGWKFTCAMWRIHPRTREFQIFAEGTSNPWGIAINDEGDFFVSACVIDHLWHIVETGYYIRQGGPYPPHTWPIESIVDHTHQKAAYCGITWFDSDAYPEEYRKVLYMGNIHGGCINADVLERNGSTYNGKPHPGFPAKPGAWDHDEYNLIRKAQANPEASRGRESPDASTSPPKLADLLTANDAWFMPVVQKTGPDGCLYILDWYDRYHCYQDANADPAGIERAKGRLYRLRYKDTPHAQPFDLAKKSDDQLIEMLQSGNGFIREQAQRLLGERNLPETASKLHLVAMDKTRPREERLGAISAWAGMQGEHQPSQILSKQFNWPELSQGDKRPQIVGNRVQVNLDQPYEFGTFDTAIRPMCVRLLFDDAGFRTSYQSAVSRQGARWETQSFRQDDAATQLQLIVGLSKLEESDSYSYRGLFIRAARLGDDALLSHLIWENGKRLIERNPQLFIKNVIASRTSLGTLSTMLSRGFEVACDTPEDGAQLGLCLSAIVSNANVPEDVRLACLKIASDRAREGSLGQERLKAVAAAVSPVVPDLSGKLRSQSHVLLAIAGDTDAIGEVRIQFSNPSNDQRSRLEALRTLIAARDASVLKDVDVLLAQGKPAGSFRSDVIATLAGVPQPEVANILLKHFDSFEPDVKPKAIEVLCQRAVTAVPLLRAIEAGKVDKSHLNLNQVRQVAAIEDETLKALVAKVFGAVRSADRSDRRHVIANVKEVVKKTEADPLRGEAVFKKVCAQCHKLYGDGAEVGPDITRNGRNNWDQLLQNLLDPSQVIGPGYQARILITDEGRVLTGLPVEESDQRVVLKIQGGKTETIPRDQIEVYKVSDLSMMPEDLEKQLQPQELVDLLSFLALDKHPKEADAKLLPGYGK
jgi:putative membrane-bound dehydrogenase-like protein